MKMVAVKMFTDCPLHAWMKGSSGIRFGPWIHGAHILMWV